MKKEVLRQIFERLGITATIEEDEKGIIVKIPKESSVITVMGSIDEIKDSITESEEGLHYSSTGNCQILTIPSSSLSGTA